MSERDRRPPARSEETFRKPHVAAPTRATVAGAHEPVPTAVDAVIDHAVRDMMNVDADAALRARVLARLDRPEPHRLRPLRMLLAGSAGAGLILAVMLPRISTPVQPAIETPIASQPAPQLPAAQPQQSAESRGGSAAAPADEQPRRGRSRAPSNVTQVVPAGALVATLAEDHPGDAGVRLEGIEPLRILPLQPEAFGPPLIVVTPITQIPELQIAPLSPRNERN